MNQNFKWEVHWMQTEHSGSGVHYSNAETIEAAIKECKQEKMYDWYSGELIRPDLKITDVYQFVQYGESSFLNDAKSDDLVVHFYESSKNYPLNRDILHDWETTRRAILDKVSEIHTTQMCMISATLLHDGYKIFVHQENGVVYEITLRSKDNCGNRAVRPSQNVYAMWANNIFRGL